MLRWRVAIHVGHKKSAVGRGVEESGGGSDGGHAGHEILAGRIGCCRDGRITGDGGRRGRRRGQELTRFSPLELEIVEQAHVLAEGDTHRETGRTVDGDERRDTRHENFVKLFSPALVDV